MSLVNLQNRKFGSLTVIDRVGLDKYGHLLWLCRCDCGNDFKISWINLKKRKNPRCNQCLHKEFDETGKRYGILTVIKKAPHGKNGGGLWICRCDCGNDTIARGSSLRKGAIKSCGCRHPLPKGEAAFNMFVSHLKSRAKDRGWEFQLTKDQILEIIQQPCFYCGCEPHHKIKIYGANGDLIYNGLDRVDTFKGYTIDNVVPCCGICNHAKAKLSSAEFKEHICRIFQNWASKDF